MASRLADPENFRVPCPSRVTTVPGVIASRSAVSNGTTKSLQALLDGLEQCGRVAAGGKGPIGRDGKLGFGIDAEGSRAARALHPCSRNGIQPERDVAPACRNGMLSP